MRRGNGSDWARAIDSSVGSEGCEDNGRAWFGSFFGAPWGQVEDKEVWPPKVFLRGHGRKDMRVHDSLCVCAVGRVRAADTRGYFMKRANEIHYE